MKRLAIAAVAATITTAVHAQGLHSMVSAAAWSEGVPEHIAHAVIRHESNYQPHLRGRAGEWGMGQIKCQTARGVGFAGSCAELRHPETNLRYSMKYLAEALRRGGSGCAGVSLYQMGVYARPRCTRYGQQVMGRVR